MHVAVIGNGITGITVARELRKLRPDCRITVISGESAHHYSRPALMYIFMGHMTREHTKPYEDWFWARNRIDLVQAWVTRVNTTAKTLELGNRAPLRYDKLVIATGSKSNRFGWPGQDLNGVQGLYDLQDLDLLEKNARNCRHAVIVGGGLIGIELGEMLHSRHIPVTFLVRESSFWNNIISEEESQMINRAIRSEGFGLILSTNLKEIVDDGSGRAGAVITEFGDRIDCDLVGLTPGVSPNTSVCEGSGVATGRGVLVDRSFRTNVPDVFSAGDCAEIVTPDGERNILEQLWYTGRMQGEVLARVLAGEEAAYDRGIWFNSAKFLDLEYQTYGLVNLNIPGERNLYWEAEDHRHAMRIVHKDDAVIGFNMMGLRCRHRICEQWIRDGRSPEYVLSHLSEANFDPEFFRRYEPEIARTMRHQMTGAVAV